MYRAYYWLPVMLLSLTGAAAVSLVATLRRQRLKVMALVNHCRLTPIVQAGWVRAVSSHTLVPGDVVVLRRGKAMCDMVLLQGACLVVESMLSGEVTYLLLLLFLFLTALLLFFHTLLLLLLYLLALLSSSLLLKPGLLLLLPILFFSSPIFSSSFPCLLFSSLVWILKAPWQWLTTRHSSDDTCPGSQGF